MTSRTIEQFKSFSDTRTDLKSGKTVNLAASFFHDSLNVFKNEANEIIAAARKKSSLIIRNAKRKVKLQLNSYSLLSKCQREYVNYFLESFGNTGPNMYQYSQDKPIVEVLRQSKEFSDNEIKYTYTAKLLLLEEIMDDPTKSDLDRMRALDLHNKMKGVYIKQITSTNDLSYDRIRETAIEHQKSY